MSFVPQARHFLVAVLFDTAGVLWEPPIFLVDAKFTSPFLNGFGEPEMLSPSIYITTENIHGKGGIIKQATQEFSVFPGYFTHQMPDLQYFPLPKSS